MKHVPRSHRRPGLYGRPDSIQRTGYPLFQFHRHTATRLIKNASVSSAVAMNTISHDTETIHRHYPHSESETQRAALNQLTKLS